MRFWDFLSIEKVSSLNEIPGSFHPTELVSWLVLIYFGRKNTADWLVVGCMYWFILREVLWQPAQENTVLPPDNPSTLVIKQ
jgi:hypothetical protein